MIIDGGSCTNVVNACFVDKLGLKTTNDAKDHEGDGPMDNSAKDLQATKNSATKESMKKAMSGLSLLWIL